MAEIKQINCDANELFHDYVITYKANNAFWIRLLILKLLLRLIVLICKVNVEQEK